MPDVPSCPTLNPGRLAGHLQHLLLYSTLPIPRDHKSQPNLIYTVIFISAGEWEYHGIYHVLVLGTKLYVGYANHGQLPAGYGPTARAVRYQRCLWYYYFTWQ